MLPSTDGLPADSSANPNDHRDGPLAQANQYSFFFGGGGKGCVGKLLAMVEMKALLAAWLLCLRITLPDLGRSQGQSGDSDGAGLSQRERRPAGMAGSLPSLVELSTHWDVANQPTDASPIHVRFIEGAGMLPQPLGAGAGAPQVDGTPAGQQPLRIFLTWPGGVGKTSVLSKLQTDPLTSGWGIITEVARQVGYLDSTLVLPADPYPACWAALSALAAAPLSSCQNLGPLLGQHPWGSN